MDKNKGTSLTLAFVILLTLGITSLFILISEVTENEEQTYIKSDANLSYAYYNYTTREVTYLDSGIPVYNKVYD